MVYLWTPMKGHSIITCLKPSGGVSYPFAAGFILVCVCRPQMSPWPPPPQLAASSPLTHLRCLSPPLPTYHLNQWTSVQKRARCLKDTPERTSASIFTRLTRSIYASTNDSASRTQQYTQRTNSKRNNNKSKSRQITTTKVGAEK